MLNTPGLSANPEQVGAQRPARHWKLIFGIVAAVGLLLLLAELAVRLIVPSVVTGIVRESFLLSLEHKVAVHVSGWQLPHLVAARIGSVDISVADVQLPAMLDGSVAGDAAQQGENEASSLVGLDPIPFDLAAHVDSMPLNLGSSGLGNGDLLGASAIISLQQDSLSPFIEFLSGGVVTTASVQQSNLLVTRDVQVLFATVPLQAELQVSATDGDVHIHPVSVRVAGAQLSAAELKRYSAGLLAPLVTEHSVCVRDQMPAGITLTSLAFSESGTASAEIDFVPTLLTDPAMLMPGVCS